MSKEKKPPRKQKAKAPDVDVEELEFVAERKSPRKGKRRPKA